MCFAFLRVDKVTSILAIGGIIPYNRTCEGVEREGTGQCVCVRVVGCHTEWVGGWVGGGLCVDVCVGV